MASVVPSFRRYCLLKRLSAADLGDHSIAAVWQHKQESEAHTDLATTFPHLTKLTAVGYTAEEDLVGATVSELRDLACLSSQEAEQVIAASAAFT